MNTRTDQNKESKNQSVAAAAPHVQSGGEAAFQFVDNRPEAVAQRKIQQLANSNLRVSQLKSIDTLQRMSDGTDFNRKSLGAKAEEKTALKQWKVGEFYAWDRTNERKDHDHIHVWQTDTDTDEVTVGGHVVTAKGTGEQSAKRNITQHEIVGTKAQDDSWSVASQKTGERLELEQGSKEVPKEKHAEEELLLRSNLENAVHYLLNTPDEELLAVDGEADKIERKLAKKLRQKLAKRKKKAEKEDASDDEAYGFDMFD